LEGGAVRAAEALVEVFDFAVELEERVLDDGVVFRGGGFGGDGGAAGDVEGGDALGGDLEFLGQQAELGDIHADGGGVEFLHAFWGELKEEDGHAGEEVVVGVFAGGVEGLGLGEGL